jgi:hypothetical protein
MVLSCSAVPISAEGNVEWGIKSPGSTPVIQRGSMIP